MQIRIFIAGTCFYIPARLTRRIASIFYSSTVETTSRIKTVGYCLTLLVCKVHFLLRNDTQPLNRQVRHNCSVGIVSDDLHSVRAFVFEPQNHITRPSFAGADSKPSIAALVFVYRFTNVIENNLHPPKTAFQHLLARRFRRSCLAKSFGRFRAMRGGSSLLSVLFLRPRAVLRRACNSCHGEAG